MSRWREVTIGEFCDVRYGYTAKASTGIDGPRFLRITDIQNGMVDWDSVPSCPISDADFVKHRLQVGDIVFARTGATTGKSYLITDPSEAVPASYLIRLRADSSDALPEYVAYFFQTADYWEMVNTGLSGSAQGGFNASKLSALRITLPPLAEQKRIVAKLDAAFAAILAATAHAQQNLTNARELFESHLNAVFDSESHNWPARSLGDLCEIARGGSPRPIKSFITNDTDGINWIKIGDATASHKYIFETKQKIRTEGVRRSRMVYDGDFIVSNSMSFGRPYIMRTTGAIHDGWLLLRDSDGTLDQDFLYLQLSSRMAAEQFESFAVGSTVRNLKIDSVKLIKVYVPEKKEQERIAQECERMEHWSQQLAALYTRKLALLAELKQSILQKAFTGELTQDAADKEMEAVA